LFFGLILVHAPVSVAQTITLLFAGDAMQHQSQIDNAFRNGRYDYSSYFQQVKNEISSADLAVVNLEVTLAGKPYKGYPQFSAPDEYAQALKEAGFDVFLNANNHIVDRGNKGILRTLSVLDSMQIMHTGVFRNKDERELHYPLIIRIGGIRLALLNYTYGTNGLSAVSPVLVNYIDKDQIKEDIRKAKDQNVDMIIANMHWGQEYKLVQNKAQEDLADFMTKEGVDLVIGSHPHVVQPTKVVSDDSGNINQLIVYSLGNFISGMVAPNTDGGQLVKVVLQKENGEVRIKSAEYTLVYSHKAKKGNTVNYTVVPIRLAEKPDAVSEKTLTQSETISYRKMKTFAKNARAVLNKNGNIREYELGTGKPTLYPVEP
jgi:poly-gamma-glutamate synthesis protein (capsule biosynthesis protein)